MKTLFFVVLIPSLLLNIALGLGLVYQALEGCAEVADGRVGVLQEELPVGIFDSGKALFTLPKGLVVREASATGAGWFEPHRFRIVVTSDRADLVDYPAQDGEPVNQDGEYYSADIKVMSE